MKGTEHEVPAEFRLSYDPHPRCDYLKDLEIRHRLVSYSLTSKGNGDKLTDAQLMLYIAQIEVAKEMACDHADEVIRMLKALLTKEQT